MLLAIHLFNLAGYTLMFDYFIHRSNRQLINRLDTHQYNDDELIEVKIALHTPYLSSWSDYERVDGEAELNGAWYTYVKRKINNDTLYLLCLPNKNKTRLNAARIEYAGKVQDVPDAKETLKKDPAGNEYQQPALWFPVNTGIAAKRQPFPHPAIFELQVFTTGPYHPPRVQA